MPNRPYSLRTIARYWRNVRLCDHGLTCLGCCWPWAGSTVKGYGKMSVPWEEHPRKKKGEVRANRLTIEIVYGPIPEGWQALHHCPLGDNTLCVNFHHLWLGTIDDNQKDSMRKGRRPTGEKHGLRLHPEACKRGEESHYAKLTTSDVYAIREYQRRGYPQWQVATLYNTSEGNVGNIYRRVSWKHLPDAQDGAFVDHLGKRMVRHRRGSDNPLAKLTDAQVMGIKHRLAQGERQAIIAREMQVAPSLISQIKHHRIWQHVS